MLILIAGITGNLGQKLAHSAFARNHRVRGLGRTPTLLTDDFTSQLESFVQIDNYWDVPALDRACAGVDAIICSYTAIPTLQLEGQLLLLRSAERAGIKRFVTATWNFDWRNLSLGMLEGYDGYISFRNIVELTSTIKPLYILTGSFAEVLFAQEGHGDFSPKNHGVWDPEAKRLEIWGSGNEVWHWTTEKDAAEYTIEIVQRDDADAGGFWTVYSGTVTLPQMAEVYSKIRSREVKIDRMGTLEELEKTALDARARGDKQSYWTYIGYFYQLYILNGTFDFPPNDHDKLPNVRRTTLEEFLLQNPEL